MELLENLLSKEENTDEPVANYSNYLNALKEVVGPNKAKEIANNYSKEEIIKGERLVDKYSESLGYSPRTLKSKLNKAIQFSEWDKQINNFDGRDYYIQNIALTFKDFENLNNKILESNSDKINDWFFFRDVITGVTRNLLTKYGVPVTEKNKKFHVGRVYSNSELKALPGLTTDKLLNVLFKKELKGQRVDEYAISGGFDNPFTAIEAASKRDRGFSSSCVSLGFTSLKQVKEMDKEKLSKLYSSFDFKGNWDSWTYHTHLFNRFVTSKINGSQKKLDEFIKIADNNGGPYLKAFSGGLENTRKILKIPEQERPSAGSIEYIRNNLYMNQMKKVPEFKGLLSLAREIDTPHKELFEKKFETKEEFLEYKKDLEEKLDYFTKDGKKAYSFMFDSIKNFKGDPRFLEGSNDHEFKALDLISSSMKYETFVSLNDNWNHRAKVSMVSKLLNTGYSVREIKEVMETNPEFRELDSSLRAQMGNLSLKEKLSIFKTGVNEEFAEKTLESVDFKKQKIPFSLLPALEANNVLPEKLRNFGSTVGFKKYKSRKGFDAIGLLNDYKTFFNIKDDPEEEKLRLKNIS
jgi:DNA-binding transcriptional MerR regulator